jgi:uncharacterized protein YjbJ (UPF0337 family)
MGATGDKLKGQGKEAVGDLTGDEELKAEGKADRQAGELKEKVDEAIDKVKDIVHPKK